MASMGRDQKYALRLNLISEEDVIKISKIQIRDEEDLFSPVLGALPRVKCETCNSYDLKDVFEDQQSYDCCYGHYGHIDLKCYFVHPLFRNEFMTAFESTCPSCYFWNTSSTKKCSLCNAVLNRGFTIDDTGTYVMKKISTKNMPYQAYTVEDIRNMFIQCTRQTSNIAPHTSPVAPHTSPVAPHTSPVAPHTSPAHTSPTVLRHTNMRQYANMTLRYVLVSSIPSRSSALSGWPSYSLNQLKYLLRATLKFNELVKNTAYVYNDLSNTRFNDPLIKYKRDVYACLIKVMEKGTITELSGKEGILRSIAHGKRIDMSCRYVIVGDARIDPRCIVVPRSAAQHIRQKIVATKDNIDQLMRLSREGRLFHVVPLSTKAYSVDTWQIRLGNTYARDAENGDIVLLNRQPTLSMLSLMSVRIMLRNDDVKAMSINPLIASAFNADFDGDEMNVYQVTGSHADARKCVESMSIENCVAKEQGRSSITFIQDTVLVLYLMTRRLEDGSFAETCSRLTYDLCKTAINAHCVIESRERYDAISLLYMCLPNSILNNVSWRRMPVLDKKKIKLLMNDIHLHEGGAVLCQFAQNVQVIASIWLMERGCSVSFNLPRLMSNPSHAKETYIDEEAELRRLKEHSETVSKESMKGTDIYHMIDSGSKGSWINMTQMISSVGQQYVLGSRPKSLYSSNTINPLAKKGYCYSSYSKGLTPTEFVFHQMAAREGVINTSVSTSESGYLARRGSIMTSTIMKYNNKTMVIGKSGQKYYLGG